MTTHRAIRQTLWLIALMTLQWGVFNSLVLPDGARILIYVLYFINLPPAPIFRTYLVFFLIGLTMDISMDTYGVNTVASTLIVPVRIWFLSKNLSLHNRQMKLGPPISSMRKEQYLLYALSLIFTFNIIWFIVVHSPHFNSIGYLILQILESSLLTFGVCFFYTEIFLLKTKRHG